MLINPHEIYPLVGFVMLLVAIIAYRFIPHDKTIDYRTLIPLAGTIRPMDEVPVEVRVRIAMMVIVSIVILASSLYTIFVESFPDATQKWAYSSIGTIVGFWLKK